MTEILKIGRLLKTDKNGFIISESSVDKIAPPWKEAVEEIKHAYLKHLGDVVHSIYIRGSVSRGEAIEKISDIDTFAVITKKPEEVDRSWVRDTRKELERKFDFSTGVGFVFVNYDALFDDALFEFYIERRLIIKTQSACIYGDDLAQTIPPFRADIQTASYFYYLKKDLEIARRRISGNPDKVDIKKRCRWVMKRIVRAGFVLVMDKERVFTRDLYPSYELLAKHFPEQEPKMKLALEFAINPTDDAKKIASFLDDFGVWIEEQLERKFAGL